MTGLEGAVVLGSVIAAAFADTDSSSGSAVAQTSTTTPEAATKTIAAQSITPTHTREPIWEPPPPYEPVEPYTYTYAPAPARVTDPQALQHSFSQNSWPEPIAPSRAEPGASQAVAAPTATQYAIEPGYSALPDAVAVADTYEEAKPSRPQSSLTSAYIVAL